MPNCIPRQDLLLLQDQKQQHLSPAAAILWFIPNIRYVLFGHSRTDLNSTIKLSFLESRNHFEGFRKA
jgi:hypothetical protein